MCPSGLFSIKREVLFGVKLIYRYHVHICIKMHIHPIDFSFIIADPAYLSINKQARQVSIHTWCTLSSPVIADTLGNFATTFRLVVDYGLIKVL